MVLKIGLDYWNDKWSEPTEADIKSISDAFSSNQMTYEEKQMFAIFLLQGTIRVPNNDEGDIQMDLLSQAMAKYEHYFSPEELSYMESEWVMTLWRYSFKDFIKAIPYNYSNKAVKTIYQRLGMEMSDDDVQKVLNSNFIYSDFFSLLKETLGDNKYIMCPDPTNAKAFVFASYFNMWHFFHILGFNGYSPFKVCADIGIISIPASDWRYIALPEGAAEAIDELFLRSRGARFPTMQQNQFLAKLANI